MNRNQVELELQRWGAFQSQRYQRDKTPDDALGSHPLSRAREFAPGTRERAAKLLASRDGRSRRLIHGHAAGIGMAPAWSTDPIPCNETRTPGPPLAQFDRGLPAESQWVERALIALGRTHPVRATVVRKEFLVSASQAVKARMVSEETGVGVSRWQYRRELALGLAFMEGQRA